MEDKWIYEIWRRCFGARWRGGPEAEDQEEGAEEKVSVGQA
jgi:hypothetical protein